MRTLISILMLCLALASCAVAPGGIRPLWTESTPPPANLAAPAGFTVTPAQAMRRAAASGLITRKYPWHLYADSTYYYVHDTSLGEAPYQAFIHGIKVDGRTGRVTRQ